MNACQIIHERSNTLRRFSRGFDIKAVPKNGVYLIFEQGETAHGGDRIVRVGTHTGDGNLQNRLNEHLYTPNKDRSIFRKHIGRCLLRRRNDPYYAAWDLDLTTPAKRLEFSHLIDPIRSKEIEEEVTSYILNNLSFTAMELVLDRISVESKLLSTLAQCPHCAPSEGWLGRCHPNKLIADSGLWNVQGMRGATLSEAEADRIFSN